MLLDKPYLNIYKRDRKEFHSFLPEMLASTLLLALVFSSTVLIDGLSGLSESCGCAIEEVESFNAGRIPSRITEIYCHQPGATCIGHFKVPIASFL